MSNIIKRGVNKLLFKRSFFRSYLINKIKDENGRRSLNKRFNKLGYTGKSNFHFFFSKIFRDKKVQFNEGVWQVNFINKNINMPLTENNLWLDWDQAISILGHDITIKQTYEDLIRRKKVNCMFDIGANYGTHSLLFLSQGIKTVTFEPNPNCHVVFNKMLQVNNLKADLVPNAVGEKDYETELYFPEKDTWLGTLSEKTKADLENKFALSKVKIKVVAIDSFLSDKNLVPDLMKIDTEGYELQVLQGAVNTINKHKPLIVFEENEGAEHRAKIADFFESVGYKIYSLPYLENHKNQISRKDFIEATEMNFIAVHNSR